MFPSVPPHPLVPIPFQATGNPPVDNNPQAMGSDMHGGLAPEMDMGPPADALQMGSLDDQQAAHYPPSFYEENLAQTLFGEDPMRRNRIATELVDAIQEDQESRKEWEDNYLRGLQYLGTRPEKLTNSESINLSKVFDTTLLGALMRFHAAGRAELFPQSGPVGYTIWGPNTPELEQRGNRIEAFMNYYLTQVDKDYYIDSDKLLLYVGLIGSAIRKIYQDPLSGKPLARFIDPYDFIVNNNCTSILSSSRITQVFYLSKKDLLLLQAKGHYLEVDIETIDPSDTEYSDAHKEILQQEGIDLEGYETLKVPRYKCYEVHVDYYLEGDPKDKGGIPLPYIITILEPLKKILRIQRNWEEQDPTFKRKECFVHYTYLPGYGLYGMGLFDCIGNNSMALTSILRQLIDAGSLRNFPGGIKAKSARIEMNDKPIGPGEFWSIETGVLPIQQVIMPMPYGEPSATLVQLREQLKQETQQLTMSAEMQIGEQDANAPVGTTLVRSEIIQRVQSSIMRSLHYALRHELDLLYGLFGKCLEYTPTMFAMEGQLGFIQAGDFDHIVRVAPISDPSMQSTTQRLMINDALLKLSQMAPELYNIRAIHQRVLETLRIEKIEEILPPPPPPPPPPPGLDAATENLHIMHNQPVHVEPWQDHLAHIQTHSMLEGPFPAASMHIQEHWINYYQVQVQHMMGQQLTPEQLQMPEIQNQVSKLAAEHQERMKLQQQQAAQANGPLDPNEIMMADILQKEQANIRKTDYDNKHLELESFKAGLKYKTDEQKMMLDKQKADDKNILSIEVEKLKHLHDEAQVPVEPLIEE